MFAEHIQMYFKMTFLSCCACDCSTILAVAGDDFAVVASDTRLSEGFMIHSRDVPKTYRL